MTFICVPNELKLKKSGRLNIKFIYFTTSKSKLFKNILGNHLSNTFPFFFRNFYVKFNINSTIKLIQLQMQVE